MKKIIILFLICVVNICAYASRDVVPSDSVLADYYTHGNVCVCIYVPTDMACNDIVLTGSFNNWSTTVILFYLSGLLLQNVENSKNCNSF